MRFNIRTLLVVTTFIAIGLALGRSVHDGTSAAYFLYNCLTLLLAAAALILKSAIGRIRRRDPANISDRNRREVAAVFAAVIGIVPFATMWAFFLAQSFGSRQPAIAVLVEALFYATVISLPAAIVALAVSFFLYLAINENICLYALRMTCLISSCFAMFLWSVANFPRIE